MPVTRPARGAARRAVAAGELGRTARPDRQSRVAVSDRGAWRNSAVRWRRGRERTAVRLIRSPGAPGLLELARLAWASRCVRGGIADRHRICGRGEQEGAG